MLLHTLYFNSCVVKPFREQFVLIKCHAVTTCHNSSGYTEVDEKLNRWGEK